MHEELRAYVLHAAEAAQRRRREDPGEQRADDTADRMYAEGVEESSYFSARLRLVAAKKTESPRGQADQHQRAHRTGGAGGRD